MLAVTVVFIRWRVASDRRMRRSWRIGWGSCRSNSRPGIERSWTKSPHGGGMRRILAVSLMLVALPGLVAPALAQTVGIVLMHGKTGSPNTVIDRLASDLQSAGYLVDTPEMCWSRQRIYDRPFLDCLTEIDSAIGRLKGRGAGRIVVAGMSQGGDAALAYGARNANLAGIIALAPAAAPERQVGLPDIAQSVAQARALVAVGRGNETASFVDRNVGGTFSVRTRQRFI
jgi:pimeloyl-ACP methyl ester carboxylesterase